MGSRRTGKTKKMINENSLPQTRISHTCNDCGHFFPEYIEQKTILDYCAHKMKQVHRDSHTCSKFTLKRTITTKNGKGISKQIKTGNGIDLIAHKMMKSKNPISYDKLKKGSISSFPRMNVPPIIYAEKAEGLPKEEQPKQNRK